MAGGPSPQSVLPVKRDGLERVLPLAACARLHRSKRRRLRTTQSMRLPDPCLHNFRCDCVQSSEPLSHGWPSQPRSNANRQPERRLSRASIARAVRRMSRVSCRSSQVAASSTGSPT